MVCIEILAKPNTHILTIALLFTFILALLILLLSYQLLGDNQRIDNLCRILQLSLWSPKLIRRDGKIKKRR